MNKTELNTKIIKVLERMGYVPKLDDDNDVLFRYQMKWVYALVITNNDDEKPFISVSLSKIYEIDDDSSEEKTAALIISNDLTQEKALTKVTVDLNRGFVNAHGMVMYTTEKAMELYFERLLSRNELGDVSSEFKRRMNYLPE